MNSIVLFVRRAYDLLVTAANYLRSPLLLALRIYFFWQLFLAGKGKLSHIGKVIDFFTSLGIPAPAFNAYFVSFLECFGGLFLIIGLVSRPIAFMVVIIMCVAYVTGDPEAAASIFKDPDKFVKADPFPYLLVSLVVFAFGPGLLSLDALLSRATGKTDIRRPNQPADVPSAQRDRR